MYVYVYPVNAMYVHVQVYVQCPSCVQVYMNVHICVCVSADVFACLHDGSHIWSCSRIRLGDVTVILPLLRRLVTALSILTMGAPLSVAAEHDFARGKVLYR